MIFRKTDSVEEATFYLKATIQNNWSRSILDIQLDSKLHARQGQAITNFDKTLPSPQVELAHETLKDPYIFEFLELQKNSIVKERGLENKLIENLQRFLVLI